MIDADHDNGEERDTQRRLRPLMVGMLIALTVFFFVVTLTQLIDLNHRIDQSPEVNLASLLAPTPCPAAASTQQCDDYRRMNIAVTLEVNLVARRHHQANVMLMASVWSRYLGFITGMVLTLIGAAFIVGQLRDRGTTVEGSIAAGKAAIASSSPGMVMVAFGVLLMGVTIVSRHQLDTRDVPLYFRGDARGEAAIPLPNLYPEDSSAKPVPVTK